MMINTQKLEPGKVFYALLKYAIAHPNTTTYDVSSMQCNGLIGDLFDYKFNVQECKQTKTFSSNARCSDLSTRASDLRPETEALTVDIAIKLLKERGLDSYNNVKYNGRSISMPVLFIPFEKGLDVAGFDKVYGHGGQVAVDAILEVYTNLTKSDLLFNTPKPGILTSFLQSIKGCYNLNQTDVVPEKNPNATPSPNKKSYKINRVSDMQKKYSMGSC